MTGTLWSTVTNFISSRFFSAEASGLRDEGPSSAVACLFLGLAPADVLGKEHRHFCDQRESFIHAVRGQDELSLPSPESREGGSCGNKNSGLQSADEHRLSLGVLCDIPGQ